MKFDNLENWDYSVDEISNSVYQITAIDKHGRKVEMNGIDIDKLISECKAAILKLDQENSKY